MITFEVDYEFEQETNRMTIEQLDRLADEDGYIHYAIRAGERHAIVHVNVEDQLNPPLTPQDAEDYFEKVYYPEQPRVLGVAEDFGQEELEAIGLAIRRFNMELFKQFMDRSQPFIL